MPPKQRRPTQAAKAPLAVYSLSLKASGVGTAAAQQQPTHRLLFFRRLCFVLCMPFVTLLDETKLRG